MIAFDTNLLFYSVNEDSPYHQQARAFLESLRSEANVAVSELVLAEFYRLLRNPAINDRPLGAAAATSVVDAYRSHPTWRLVGLPPEGRALHDGLWKLAAKENFPYQRLYDARLALSLLAQGVQQFATANLKDFQSFGFRRVWNPLVSDG